MPAPTRLSSFVGRRKELAELRRLMAHTRLLTLVGPGGAGKTRLATQFVRGYEARFAYPTIFVELGSVTEEARVVQAIARAAAVKLDATERLTSLTGLLQDRRALVVLDNCEHVIGAAAEAAARLVTDCPGLVLVATSRERLNVEGEVVWTVPPMSVATGDDLASASRSDAVGLFVDRARSVQPGFLLTADNAQAALDICRRLDGIPLAIELAAARMTTLSPAEIAARLDRRLQLLTGGGRGAAPRQQTLRATIDWSHELLDPNEQRLLQRMSVFAGSPSAEAIDEVCAFPPLDSATTMDALTRLVEKSMVQVDAGAVPTRYRLLETIREYAHEKLEVADLVAEVRDRHLARYRRLAAAAFEAQKVRGTTAEHAFLWQEMDDLRAALDWAAADPDLQLEMLGHLFGTWFGYAPAEGRDRIAAALTRADGAPTFAKSLAASVWLAMGGATAWTGPPPLPMDQLMALIMSTDDAFLVANRTAGRGYTLQRQHDDPVAARECFRTAVAGLEATGATSFQAMTMGSLGEAEMQLGDLDAARTWIERAVALASAVGDRYGSIGAHWHLGRLLLAEGNPAAAIDAFIAGLDYREPDDLLSLTYQVGGVACALVETDPTFALTLFSATDRVRTMINAGMSLPWRPQVEAATEAARASLTPATAEAAWVAGQRLPLDALEQEVRARAGSRGGKAARSRSGLSKRELQVAELVATGMTSRAIAAQLFLSERTVETHIDHVMTKLGINSRAQVAAWVTAERAGT